MTDRQNWITPLHNSSDVLTFRIPILEPSRAGFTIAQPTELQHNGIPVTVVDQAQTPLGVDTPHRIPE